MNDVIIIAQQRWDIGDDNKCSTCGKKGYCFNYITSVVWCKECWDKK